MTSNFKELQNDCINAIRFLAVDGVQKANSGHPGMPMGCAPIAYLLYTKIMNHNPSNPKWINRDRFVLSAGHGSMLLYSTLHLCGYDISLEDLKNFRQWKSITPGHPEYGLTPGVETTTGPLGQGITNAIGMAVANAFIADKFNKDDIELFDHKIYVIASDGDLMEGVSHEAASFAGHNKLDSLIVFYDDNKITIDGSLSLSMSENVANRFEGYGWYVQTVEDVNNISELEKAVENARANRKSPSLIITKTHIGFGSPNKQDTAAAHGSPLGEDEVKLSKKNLGWPDDKTFYIPENVTKFFSDIKPKGIKQEEEWNKKFETYKKKYPAEADIITDIFNGKFGDDWIKKLPAFEKWSDKIATRSASGKVLNSIAPSLPTLIGGSADLTPSNNTLAEGFKNFSAENHSGNYIRFGIREHAMAGIMNGMALYGGVIPYGGTFLVFSDYLRPAIRLASLSGIKPIYVFTHDSIGLGEDGPTHQPVEHIASLRAIPGVVVIRPADANETVYAWKAALQHSSSPVALILTRQKLPVIDRSKYNSAEGLLKGAYVIKDTDKIPDLILIATGSEVSLALDAAEKMKLDNIKCRVVSMPSWELFEKQSNDYKESVLPVKVKARISIETGVKFGWERYTGGEGKSISIEKFGASAPYQTIFENYGFTADNIIAEAKDLISKI